MGRGMYKRKTIKPPIPMSERPSVLFKVKVTHPSLRIRSKPSTTSDVLGIITNRGIYDITEVKDGFGKLKDEDGWIMLKYTEIE